MDSFVREHLFDAAKQVIVFRQFLAKRGGFDCIILKDVRRLSEAEVERSNPSGHFVGWCPPLPVSARERRRVPREFAIWLPSGGVHNFGTARAAVRWAVAEGFVPVVRSASGRVRVLRVPA